MEPTEIHQDVNSTGVYIIVSINFYNFHSLFLMRHGLYHCRLVEKEFVSNRPVVV